MPEASVTVGRGVDAPVPVRLLPDHLIAIGEPVVSTRRASDLVGLDARSVHAGLSRLRSQGRLFAPARGLHVAVPPQYRSWGVVPAEWFIDPMMRHLGRRYYVGLLSAAAIHGAAHQAPQVFQVLVDRQLADRDLGRVRLRFHVSARLAGEVAWATERVTTETGAMNVSSRELTSVDVVANPRDCGGLDNVATVLIELGELDVVEVAALLGFGPRAVARRLGWLLDAVVGLDGLDRLRRLASPDEGDATPLDIDGPRAGNRDPAWGVVVNTDVVPDV